MKSSASEPGLSNSLLGSHLVSRDNRNWFRGVPLGRIQYKILFAFTSLGAKGLLSSEMS